MNKVVKKQETSLTLSKDLQGSWGTEGVDSADILIPRLLLMQPLSELVGQNEAQPGNIIKSTNAEVLYDGKKVCEIIPIMTFKTWRIMELKDGKFEFNSIIPITADNVNEPYEWSEGNVKYRRDKAINYYVLLPSEIKKEIAAFKTLQAGDIPDAEDCLIPCLLSFMRTSSPAGRQLATFFKQAQHFNISPATATFRLFSEFEKNDKGSYYTFKIEKTRKSTEEEISMAKRWYETLRSSSVKIDETKIEEDAPVKTDAYETTDTIDDSF